MSLLINSVILVNNATICRVISLLREDPLSPGILDIFFENIRIIRLFVKLRLYT
jgi:hypothetical protein